MVLIKISFALKQYKTMDGVIQNEVVKTGSLREYVEAISGCNR